jgi:hypothetical protein
MVIAGAVLAGQVIRLGALGVIAPDVVRGARRFAIENIPEGTVVTQSFEARANGLEIVRMAGVVAGEGHGAVDAWLIEEWSPGDARVVRRGTIDVRAGEPCCTARFSPIRDSQRRRYRLELSVRDLMPTLRLSLNAVPTRRPGGLVLNGRRQFANLTFGAGDTDLGPVRGAPRFPAPVLMGVFAVIDAALGFLFYTLLTASDRPPA